MDSNALAPAITAALGLIGLFVDRKSRSFYAILPLFVVGVAVSAWLQFTGSAQQQAQLDSLQSANRALLSGVGAIGGAVDALVVRELGEMLRSFGMTDELAGSAPEDLSQDDLLEVVAASRERSRIVSTIDAQGTAADTRAQTRVRYYAKERDNRNLKRSLISTGLTLEETAPTTRMANETTNAVWHGADVPIEHFKLVVLSLMRAKVPIRQTGPVCRNQDAKAHYVEVGASVAARGMPLKTFEVVVNAQSYGQLDNFSVEQCDEARNVEQRTATGG